MILFPFLEQGILIILTTLFLFISLVKIGIHVSDIKDTSLEIHYMESIQSKWLSGLILILLSLILKLSLLVVFGN